MNNLTPPWASRFLTSAPPTEVNTHSQLPPVLLSTLARTPDPRRRGHDGTWSGPSLRCGHWDLTVLNKLMLGIPARPFYPLAVQFGMLGALQSHDVSISTLAGGNECHVGSDKHQHGSKHEVPTAALVYRLAC